MIYSNLTYVIAILIVIERKKSYLIRKHNFSKIFENIDITNEYANGQVTTA